jgi:regulator of cell morphogenesis and NO signaling
MEELSKLTVGEIVTQDFRSASVFKKAGIDFCCGGSKSLSQACDEVGLDQVIIEKELRALEMIPQENSINFIEWDLGFLCEYIKNTHHKFVLKTLPEILFYSQKIASVHGDRHPELIEIAEICKTINDELIQHLQKEETMLFPAIVAMLSEGEESSRSIIYSEISRMKGEHEFAGAALDKINELSNHYHVPEDGCNSYQLSYKLIEKFEDDLHVHVHLENNILFPKALKL